MSFNLLSHNIKDHYKLGSSNYKTDFPNTHLNISTVFTDSEDDDVPLSTYVTSNDSHQSFKYYESLPGISNCILKFCNTDA